MASGRTLMGVRGVSAEAKYLNFVKGSDSPRQLSGTQIDWQARVNGDGYFTSSPGADVFRQMPFMRPLNASTRIVTKWTGTARYRWDRGAPGFTIHSGGGFVVGSAAFNLDISGTNVRVVWSFGSGTVPTVLGFYAISAGVFSGHSNLIVCREEDEALVDAGVILNPDYLAAQIALNPRVLRFMDEQVTNDSNVSSFSYRKQTSALSYEDGTVWHPGAWAGNFIGTDTYSSAPPIDGAPVWVDGAAVQGFFLNANTITAPTYTDGVRPAKTIISAFGTALTVGQIPANAARTLTYSSVLDGLIVSGAFHESMPFETQALICNQVGCDLYFNIPHLYTSVAASSAATLFRSILSASLWAEFSSEVWNNGFGQTQIGYVLGGALGFPVGDFQERLASWYGLRFMQLIPQFEAAYSGNSSSLKKVIAVQEAGDGTYAENYRLLGADLGPFGFSAFPNRPVDHCTHLSYAVYYYGTNSPQTDSEYNGSNTPALLTHTDNYINGNSAQRATEIAWLRDNIQSVGSESLESHKSRYATWLILSNRYNRPIVMYEGALAINPPSTSRLTALGFDPSYAAKVTTFFNGFRGDLLCYNQVIDMYNFWIGFNMQGSVYGWYVPWGNPPWNAAGPDLYTLPYDQPWNALVAINNPPAGIVGPGTAVPIPSPPGNKILTIGGITGC